MATNGPPISTPLAAAVLNRELARAAALLAGGADVNQQIGRAARGVTWSRKTHKYFPAPARARAAELMRVGQWLKRLPSDFPIPFELWETFVVPQAVGRDYKPPPPQ